MPSDNLIALARGSVLYLGSAVPLETSVGLEALQMPLRDRYLTTDSGQKVSGIDAVLTVFSSGLLMQYPGDDSSSTWFPMQTLHMCAAVRAVYTQGSAQFVSVDSPQAQTTREPPLFAVIMRRSRGVKVLECHVFVCKSTESALAFVQSCTHAFQHQEGWLSGMPGSDQLGGGMSRIVAADSMSGMGGMARTPLQGFMYSADQPTHMYNITGTDPPSAPAPAPVQAPAPAPVPSQPVQQTGGAMQYIVMNPPGAPVPQYPQMTIPQGYFADWDQNYGMSYMIIPDSPFYPGDVEYNKEKKKRHKKKKKKPKKAKKKVEEEEEEEELYYVRRSKLGEVPPEFVPVQQGEDRYVIQASSAPRYTDQRQATDQWPPEVRYSSQPVRPPVQLDSQNDGGREIHYIPLPKPSQNPAPDQMIQATTADIVHFARVPTDYGNSGNYLEGQGPQPFDPYSYRTQPPGLDYDYRREYDAARQQQGIYGSGPQQGVYDRKLPRTNYQHDERSFGGLVDRLGYSP